MPSSAGSGVLRVTVRTVKPACRSRVRAVGSSSPITSGTVAAELAVPVGVLVVVVVVLVVVVAVGVAVVVVVVAVGPLETLMRTVEPRGTRAPAAGFCATTVPAGSPQAAPTGRRAAPAGGAGGLRGDERRGRGAHRLVRGQGPQGPPPPGRGVLARR